MTDTNTDTDADEPHRQDVSARRQPAVKPYVDAVFNDVVDYAEQNGVRLPDMADGVFVNEYATPAMEDADLADVFAVAEAGPIDLAGMGDMYGGYDDYEKAVRHFAASNLNHLVIDRISDLAGPA